MPEFEAILFDFDGVLVDSEPVHYDCWREVLRPYGLSLDWDDYVRNCVGVSDKAMIQALCDLFDRSELFGEIWSKYGWKKSLFRERMVRNVPMPSETKALLLSIEGYQLAVVSSSGRLEVEPALESAGVRPVFGTIVTGEDVRQLKPSPEPYRTAASRLKVERALVVEDSDAGVASGVAAGFEVLRVPSAEAMAGMLRKRLGG